MSEKSPSSGPLLYLLGCSALDRFAYRLLLEQTLEYPVAVDSSFEPTRVWKAMRIRPDLALVDADTPSPGAREAIQIIPQLCPKTKLLVVGAAVEPALVKEWGSLPIAGYVVKDGGPEELRAAITAVLSGSEYFSEGVRAAILDGRSASAGRARLSRREAELLPLLARGLTLREAAHRLAVGYKTADTYRTNLLKKLGIHSRVELARYAIRERIIEP